MGKTNLLARKGPIALRTAFHSESLNHRQERCYKYAKKQKHKYFILWDICFPRVKVVKKDQFSFFLNVRKQKTNAMLTLSLFRSSLFSGACWYPSAPRLAAEYP